MWNALEQLRKAKHIWIYGAGIVGNEALEMFSKDMFHLPVDGVVVSRLSDKCTLHGYKVNEIGSVNSLNEESVFVIAVTLKYQQEIIKELASHGYENYVIWDRKFMKEMWLLADFRFEDRQKGFSKTCFVLSGYKEFLWDDIFERLMRFVPDDVDVCIVSSGLWSDRLSQLAKENGWSYLSTEINSITLIQNIAIQLFPQAEWIYKMDEDMFLTQDCFGKILRTYLNVEEKEPYKVGFAAPLIPVNGYGYIRILNRLGELKTYEDQFGRAIYGGNTGSMIEKGAEAARFMWGADGRVPRLDRMNEMFSLNTEYSICGVRFSIGFILFRRSLWEEMDGFSVSGRKDLGVDEIELCKYCIYRSLAIVVAENTVVGHFSFGPQTGEMQELYTENPKLFAMG